MHGIDIFVQLCAKMLGLAAEKEYRFHAERLWRFDYAFPQHKIALEVEGGVHTGGRHIRPKGFLGDMEKYNAAAVLGWRVLRCTPSTLTTTTTFELIENAINYGECNTEQNTSHGLGLEAETGRGSGSACRRNEHRRCRKASESKP